MMLLPLLILLLSTLVFSAVSFIPASESTQHQQHSGPPGMPSNALQYNRTDVTPNRQMEQLMGNNTYVFAYRNVTMMMNCSKNTEMNITIDPMVRTRYLALVMEQNQSALLTMNISVSPPPGLMTMQRTLNFYWGIVPNATLQMRVQLKLHINSTVLNSELNRVINTSRLSWMYWNTSMNGWMAVESHFDADGYLVCETRNLSAWTVAETAPGMPNNALHYNRMDITPYKQREQVMANNTYVFAYRNVTMMMNCSKNTELNITTGNQVRTRYFALYMIQNQPVRLDMNISTSLPPGVMTMLRTLNFYWSIEPNATIQLNAQLRMHIDGTVLNSELGRAVNTSRLTWMYWNTSGNGWNPVESWMDEDGYLVCNTTRFSTWTIAEIIPITITPSLSKETAQLGETVKLTVTLRDQDGDTVDGGIVEARVKSTTIQLQSEGNGVYEANIDTTNLGKGTLTIFMIAQKDGYSAVEKTMNLKVQTQTPWSTYALLGTAIIAGAVIVFYLLKRR